LEPLHAVGSLATNRSCLLLRATAASVSPQSCISVPLRVVSSAPSMDLV
jgi:hypothetical protein